MSRIALVKSRNLADRIAGKWCGRLLNGHNAESADRSACTVFVVVAEKRTVPGEQWFTIDEDNWIVSAGTILTEEGSVGSSALNECWALYGHGGIQAVRAKTFGHWGLVICKAGIITAFVDGAGSYAMFFPESNTSDLILSNSLASFADLGFQAEGGDLGILKAVFFGPCGISRQTMLSGVNRLSECESWYFNKANGQRNLNTVISEPIEVPQRFDEATDKFFDLASSLFESFGKFTPVGINATGGLDSRAVFAFAKHTRLNAMLMHGVGNSKITGTYSEDRKVSEFLANHYGWPYFEMDWGQSEPYRKRERLSLHEKLEFAQLYGASAGFINALEGQIDPYPLLQLGGYCPAFMNSKPWESEDVPQTLRRYAERLAHRCFSSVPGGGSREELTSLLERDLQMSLRFEKGGSFDDTLDKQSYLALAMRVGEAQQRMILQSFNEFCYYVAPFATSAVYRFLCAVPAQWRAKDRFQLAFINKADKGSLEAPIFSGGQKFSFDRARMIMAISHPQKNLWLRVKPWLPSPLVDLLKETRWKLRHRRPAVRLAQSRRVEDSVSAAFRDSARHALTSQFDENEVSYEALSKSCDLNRLYRFLAYKELLSR